MKKSGEGDVKDSVLISVRLSRDLRAQFADLCARQGLSVSEAVRRMIAHAVAQQTVQPDDIWDTIAKGRLPAGFKNRFAMLPELTKDLPAKDDDGEEPWHVRPENEWKKGEVF